MTKNRIGIVGSGIASSKILDVAQKQDVLLVAADQQKQTLDEMLIESIPIKNYSSHLPFIPTEQPFKMKKNHKHEYLLVGTEEIKENIFKQIWQCKCGRKL